MKDVKIENKETYAIEVISFSKKYPRNKNYSVKDMSFHVKQGDFHGFIGANGAGKTTIIKSIIGAYARYDGKVFILGKPNTLKASKKKIGYIPESALFPQAFSTVSYLRNMALISGMPRKICQKFAVDKLKELGLESIAKRNPNKLSSGQKKKVLLAQALLHNPKVIIMDEPAANLDPKARTDFFKFLVKLKKENNVTIFISSHILDELEKYVDSITIIDGGNKAFSGNIQQAIKDNSSDGLSKNKWNVVTSNIEKTSKIFKELKLEFTIDTNKFMVPLTDLEAANIHSKLVKGGVEVIKLIKIGNDLSSIYDLYVKRGSLDIEKKGGGE